MSNNWAARQKRYTAAWQYKKRGRTDGDAKL